MSTLPDMRVRCAWCPTDDALYVKYHDEEWGVPVYDDDPLFEMLCLEGQQAGLSWRTVLHKREGYRAAFDRFDARLIAGYGPDKIAALLLNPGIVRNRLKVNAIVKNARAFLDVQAHEGSFSRYLWSFVGGAPQIKALSDMGVILTSTPQAEAMSAALRKRGFTFVGPTICYAFMQATGMVDDHMADCFKHNTVSAAAATPAAGSAPRHVP